MKPHFLFSASPLNPKMIDEAFQYQAIALKQAGFNTSVISFETETIYARPRFAEDEVVVYRGWMLSEKEFDVLLDQIDLMGGKPLTSKEQYYATHYIPNWYPLVTKLTPEVVSFGNSPETHERVYNFCLGAFSNEGTKLQVKDYVKSLKTAGGSVVTSADEVKETLANMEKFRGTIEGGVVLRRYEEFVPGSEKRFFVINGRYFGQEAWFDTRVMSMLNQVARDIPSPFFSVDIAYRADKGDYRIVEMGDGQVSDLVGWTDERFAEIWK